MTTVEVAREAGACYGVERALEMTENALNESGSRVRTLGPLIHNPRVVASLTERGASVVEDPRDAAGCTLVLRTHGVTPAEEAEARELCSGVIDATCPFVKKVHRAAEKLSSEGYRVVIVGESGHPEVTATLAHAPGATVVGTPEEARDLPHVRKTGVVVQTTQSAARLAEIVSVLLTRTEELRVINTICEATSGHQGACAELAARADVMVVIGGRNSANTTRLAEIARAACPRTYHIEGADELDSAWFDEAGLVGVTAGASTPASQIRAVVSAIESVVGE